MAKGLPLKEGLGKKKIKDVAKVKELFMASPYLDWTRFAESQGWDALFTRREFPVRNWQVEKRDALAAKQTDVLSALFFERRFTWTREIIDTLDKYPKSIDNAKAIADAKMSEIADKYQDYVKWKNDPSIPKVNRFNKRIRHPFEQISLNEVSALLKGMKDITEAKIKALMLDKWAIGKLDIPEDEMAPQDETGVNTAHRITVEGQGEITPDLMQDWLDRWVDKPALPEPEDK